MVCAKPLLVQDPSAYTPPNKLTQAFHISNPYFLFIANILVFLGIVLKEIVNPSHVCGIFWVGKAQLNCQPEVAVVL